MTESQDDVLIDFSEMIPRMEHAWQSSRSYLHSYATNGHWSGELSTSSLSTATAISALSLCRKHDFLPEKYASMASQAIETGCQWLAAHQNADGGFGDTDRSHSNIATSMLVQAAWSIAGFKGEAGRQIESTEKYINLTGKWDALRRRYGKDKTFVVPILTNCALAGLAEWKQVPSLPFEAAWLPQSWYRMARMPVVSYAIPALVAMGQAKFHFQPPLNPILKSFRRMAIAPTLKVLARMQPDSGGYLEAVPLTSFVLMSLAAIGKGELPVAQNAIRFLIESRLSDGSWPIDTNLATWLTSLTVVSLSRRSQSLVPVTIEASRAEPSVSPSVSPSLPTEVNSQTVRWLLSCQHQSQHPFTGAMPGGWGWTDLSGAVPDADDTPAALLAIASLDLLKPNQMRLRHQSLVAAAKGLGWLIALQNRDGGWPTFCRGWGKLPFDRSGTDLTAHALRAFNVWLPQLDQLRKVSGRSPSEKNIAHAMKQGLRYLARKQRPDGSWLPLWFGNQDHADEDNPIYGTAKVLLAYADLGLVAEPHVQQGLKYLVDNQNSDGGWGGGPSVPYRVAASNEAICSSIEETALALEALIQCGAAIEWKQTLQRGLSWLVSAIEQGHLKTSWPIGFYFAKLWYHERLYPAIFSLSALASALRAIETVALIEAVP